MRHFRVCYILLCAVSSAQGDRDHVWRAETEATEIGAHRPFQASGGLNGLKFWL